MEGRYHHGDLRRALLVAAEEELIEKGVERFSLRSVAKRAGVSHAAPAHHFGDVSGLLLALAAEGAERFLATQKARQARAAKDPDTQLLESGMGYIDFALAHPALFRLMFGQKKPDAPAGEAEDPRFAASFLHLVDNVSAVIDADAMEDPAGRRKIVASWAMVHGLADLMISGRPHILMDEPAEAREAMLREIISNAFGGDA